LTAERTTSKGTGSISCEVEFCIFYRLSLRTLRTKDIYLKFLTCRPFIRNLCFVLSKLACDKKSHFFCVTFPLLYNLHDLSHLC
jgi:hypothetical protein